MKILKELPKKITKKPIIKINSITNEKYAIIDNIYYKINNEIKLIDLIKIWKKNKKGNEKNIIYKDVIINKIKITDDINLTCSCNEFYITNNCKHLIKIKKIFNF